mgnify:CR=1 FL=1
MFIKYTILSFIEEQFITDFVWSSTLLKNHINFSKERGGGVTPQPSPELQS